jgi:Tfp pilus assembly protein PilZ
MDKDSQTGIVPPDAEITVTSFLEAVRLLREMEAESQTPLRAKDPVFSARKKQVETYILVFLKSVEQKQPTFRLLETPQDLKLPVKAEVIFDDSVHFYEALKLSFGKGGIYIKTDLHLPIDSILDLKVILSVENVSFKVVGKIIWVNPRATQGRPAGLGVKFHKLSPLQRQVLEDFIAGVLPPDALPHLSE